MHYRDGRTAGMVEQALRTMDARTLYGATGNQIMAINTLFQLLAVKEQAPEVWRRAKRLLFMPDLFIHALCGAQVCERTIASTSQMQDAHRRMGQGRAGRVPYSERLFALSVPSGTVVGALENGAKVVAVAGHDTQCAVAALPTQARDTAFLSCGTWSLLGCELDAPVLTEESMRLGLSNELGANGRVNYLKNIIGLWLIQESRREWRREGREYSYAELESLALEARAAALLHRPGRSGVYAAGDIPARVREYCAATGQYVPQTVGRGDALHLRKFGTQIPVCAGPAGGGNGQALCGAARSGRRRKRRPFVPHDGGRYGPAHSSRPGGGHGFGAISSSSLWRWACCRPLMRDGGSLQKQNV